MFERIEHEGGGEHQDVHDNEAALSQGAVKDQLDEQTLDTLTIDIMSLADADCDKILHEKEIDLVWESLNHVSTPDQKVWLE